MRLWGDLWAERLVGFICRRAVFIVAGALALAVAGGWLASRITLKANPAEVLPRSDPLIRELTRLQTRLAGTETLIVNIESEDRAANLRFAKELTRRLRALPPELVSLVQADLHAEERWFERHGWLYPQLSDLRRVRDRLRERIRRAKMGVIDFEGDDGSVDALRRHIERKRAQIEAVFAKRLPGGSFITADGRIAMVMILPPVGIFHEGFGRRLVRAVRREIESLHPAMRGLTVGLSSDIEMSIEEHDALSRDLVLASAVCVTLVCLAVALFYRRWRAVPLMAAPALLAAVLAYGIEYLVFGAVYSVAAFLGSIIVGNGINFAIIQLARYEEERKEGADTRRALVRALATTARPTGIAALAATVAYCSLGTLSNRGFVQFGIIGAIGMTLAWVATMILLPALLWLLDGRREAARAPHGGPLTADHLALVAMRSPRVSLLLFAVVTAVMLVALPGYLRDPFEHNLKRLLSARVQSMEGAGRWYAANDEVFGRALNPVVFLTQRAEQAEPVRRALREADARGRGPAMLERVITIADFLPGPVAEQREKINVLRDIRALLVDPELRLLDKREREKLLAHVPPPDLRPITTPDLPPLLRRWLTEKDGRSGRIVLALPKESGYDAWDERDMRRLGERVGEVRFADGAVLRGIEKALVFGAMLRSFEREGPLATLVCGVSVLLLVFALARGIVGAMLVLCALAAGMLWTVGAAALLGTRLNGINFAALPVTLGIAVDYGINIYSRWRLHEPGGLQRLLRTTGAAVVLCSLTTIIGYGSLLFVDNGGLRSFGTLAILGEGACLCAALLLLPALFAHRRRRARERSLEHMGSA